MSDILLVGCGHLGTALLHGWLYPDPKIDSAIVVTRTVTTRAQELKNNPRTNFADPCPDIEESRIVVLAVKPVMLRDAYNGVRAQLKDEQRIVSVAAGVPLEKLKAIDPSKRWARAMPSLAAAQRRSVTALYNADTETVDLFARLGGVLKVSSDREIDFTTLLSGSGPGVLAWQAQAWFEAATVFGLQDDQAKILVKAMMQSGAALLDDAEDFQSIVGQVATKGGTTEAMIEALKKADVQNAVKNALSAGLNKAAEISEKL